ncbi:hypothetical protein SCP_0114440 [Sparassis crispa]|uniref:Uncharacterized protein n=1 Tax=Sparassis crispa TaxID=139825 RepID=A0A401G8R2_9APHY|nr:hypothetical protein SCP_0114440 [Sparassis crispa]GBE78555.1 hypothetical protein SCP_0114440 [Sparassis crispa]
MVPPIVIPSPSVTVPVTPRSHLPSDSSSSSSDSSGYTPPAPISTMPFCPLATILQSSIKHPPSITSGKLTPSLLLQWEVACLEYFKRKSIADLDKVSHITGGMQDKLICDWVMTNASTLTTVSWDDFIKLMCSHWLEKDWEDKVLTVLIRMTHDNNNSLEDWIVTIEKQTLLRASPARNPSSNLSSATRTERMDNERRADKHRHMKEIERFLHSNCHISPATTRPSFSFKPTPKRISSSSSATTKSTCLGPLTNKECELLKKFFGCFKCRHLFVKCCTSDCMKGFPNATFYTTLTSDVRDVFKKCGHLFLDFNAKTLDNTVTVISTVPNNTDLDDNYVAAINAYSPLALTSDILGSGTDSEGNKCVLADFTVPHILWRGSLLSHFTAPLMISMLIDSGSLAALIRDSLATQLGLHHHTLAKPFPLGDAWDLEQQNLTNIPVIFGNPFLKCNHIIADVEAGILINKISNHDIMQPITPQSTPQSTSQFTPPDLRSLRECRHDATKAHDLAAHNQLVQHCDLMRDILLHTQPLLDSTVTISITSTVVAVPDGIEDLAYQETLSHENATMKNQFTDCFPDDIHHLDYLPTDVFHRFHLKDPNMVITR